MSIIATAAAGVMGPLFELIDNLFTSDEEKAEAKRKLVELEQQGRLAQIAVNLQEAQHESVFVAGWRPAIGWICGLALAYSFIVQPFAAFVLVAFAPEFPVGQLPELDLAPLLGLLGGMLGLAGMRSYEKRTGTNRNRGGAPAAPPVRGFRSGR